VTPDENARAVKAHRDAEARRDYDAILDTFTADCSLATAALAQRGTRGRERRGPKPGPPGKTCGVVARGVERAVLVAKATGCDGRRVARGMPTGIMAVTRTSFIELRDRWLDVTPGILTRHVCSVPVERRASTGLLRCWTVHAR
jgi:hypothetical protein